MDGMVNRAQFEATRKRLSGLLDTCPGGVSADAIAYFLGIPAATVPAVVSDVRKAGKRVESSRTERGVLVYRTPVPAFDKRHAPQPKFPAPAAC